nr:zinc finger, CCHC-type [Tanacetum cinerariifolium]
MKMKALGASRITTEMVTRMDQRLRRRKEESSISGLPSKRKRKASVTQLHIRMKKTWQGSSAIYVKRCDTSTLSAQTKTKDQLMEPQHQDNKARKILIAHQAMISPSSFESAKDGSTKGLLPSRRKRKASVTQLHIRMKKTWQGSSAIYVKRLGHLNFESLKTMNQKDLVHGVPAINHTTQICDVCLVGKQSRAPFPKKAKGRSTSPPDLIYGDLCRPITPPKPSGKRYIFLLVDDYSRYMWAYFLSTKDQAFDTFKEFKKTIENELRTTFKMFRTDRGGEFNSSEFTQYYKENGLARQLTTPYSPQQNGVELDFRFGDEDGYAIRFEDRELVSKWDIPRKVRHFFIIKSSRSDQNFQVGGTSLISDLANKMVMPLDLRTENSYQGYIDGVDEAVNQITCLQLENIHVNEPEGDILIFMTGQDDIEKLVSRLEEKIQILVVGSCMDAVVLPLHGSLPPEMQASCHLRLLWSSLTGYHINE